MFCTVEDRELCSRPRPERAPRRRRRPWRGSVAGRGRASPLASTFLCDASAAAGRAGSWSSEARVKLRSARTVRPYMSTAAVDILAPGGSSMKGMNLSGKPGMVQPMQIPPTLGQPPTPLIQPRLGTLQLDTGPQQPSFTMHLGEPWPAAKSACS